jgi:hypothetical protein
LQSSPPHPCLSIQGGLRRLLAMLRALLLLLKAGGPDARPEKQVGYHACCALRHYFRAHLLLHLQALQRRLGNAPPKRVGRRQTD